MFVSGTAPIWPEDHFEPDAAAQARRCFEIIKEALAEAGAEIDDVVRTRIFLVDADDADAVAAVHGEVFGGTLPASTFVVVAALLDARWRVEIEADALIGSELPSSSPRGRRKSA